MEQKSSLDLLGKKLGVEWPAIAMAKSKALEKQEAIRTALTQPTKLFNPSDLSITVFGSIARLEFTEKSDVDWTLLIDGQAQPEHLRIAFSIQQKLHEKGLKPPTAGGAFGSMAFSHDIIHLIGGQRDTNHNTTQRILLLLESAPIYFKKENGKTEGYVESDAYERVIRGVIQKYLLADSGFAAPRQGYSRVPRFLLNDIVRFWRTMCVDFAWKGWEQDGQKWALRNIKLRMSRRLIFISGLLMIASCYRNNELKNLSASEEIKTYLQHLEKYVKMTPLEVVADLLPRYVDATIAGEFFDHYDKFLQLLNDKTKREELEHLHEKNAYGNIIFEEARELSHEFHNTLTKIFFIEKSDLKEFTIQFGVF